jgi:hypothetical protein
VAGFIDELADQVVRARDQLLANGFAASGAVVVVPS